MPSLRLAAISTQARLVRRPLGISTSLLLISRVSAGRLVAPVPSR